MKETDLLENLLFLYSNITITINLKDKLVKTLYQGNTCLAKNISYSEFANRFATIYDLNDDSKNKLFRFFNNLNPNFQPFVQPASYESNSNESIVFDFKGIRYDEDNVMVVIENFLSSAHDQYDDLTKVFTRDVILDKVKDAINNNEPFVLMIVDVDNFKTFNADYGHMFGDIVLVETAASIKKFLGNNGYVGRTGGDEFIVIYKVKNDYDEIYSACRRIRQAITNVNNHNIKQAQITSTIGCSAFPSDATDFDTLFRKAEKALVRGKKKGRNCFIIFDEIKCSNITDADIDDATKFDSFNQINTNSNIVAGIFEILNRGGDHKKNINDSLSLIGNYFLLDRIVLCTLKMDKQDAINSTIEWINPRTPENKGLVVTNNNNISLWRKSYDQTGMLKYVQLDSNKDTNPELYNLLKGQNVSAILAFEMKHMNSFLGMIRFDMCSSNRFWSQADVSSLMLISKIFAIYINKEREDTKHIRALLYDDVTGLYNYTKWRDSIDIYLGAQESFVRFSIISFQIDNFHNFNDLYGVSFCYEALNAVAEGLREIYGENAIYCRLNQEKFFIFLPSDKENIIEENFEKLSQYLLDHPKLGKNVNISGGVYIHDKLDSINASADKASLARQQHSHTTKLLTYFNTEMYEADKKKAELEIHMHEAIKNNEFLLYLQPKVNTHTNEIVGAEALTRWNFKNEKILTPNHFIPLFEKNGFITELDYTVFENVCKFQRKCIDDGLKPIKISVNVSRYQSNFDSYLNEINKIREKYDIDPSLIEIEITEGMYIDNINRISSFMDKLHSCGYSISMDDFGAGYSNLSSLATLDFDLIKLDKGFCNNPDNKKEGIILSFVMSLAKNLNVDVLCEGVETEEFAKYLKDIGCNLVQGFLYEKPIPADDFKKKYLLND